jgi:hypothetical protein
MHFKGLSAFALTASVLAIVSASSAFAQQVADNENVETVVVTGSRFTTPAMASEPYWAAAPPRAPSSTPSSPST